MEKNCNCGGHGHHEHHGHGGEGGCCGGHGHHEHHGHGSEGCGCGCGGHHEHHGHGGEGCGCGCGGHHDHGHHDHDHDDFEEAKEIVNAPATPEQLNFLRNFAPIAPLPVVKYLVKSSKEHSFESVALRDVCLRSAADSIPLIKETAAFLQGLEASNLIAIDYDTPLADESYAHYATADSFVLFQETVAQGAENESFLGDIATLEKGSIVMTAWGKSQLEA